MSANGESARETPFESRIQSARASRDVSPVGGENKSDSTGSTASEAERTIKKKVRDLASAVLQVSQMIEERYFKQPLGEDEKEKKKRLKEEEKRKKVQYSHF